MSAFGALDIPKTLITRTVSRMKLVAPSGHVVMAPLEAGREVAMVRRGEFDIALRGLAAEAGAQLIEAAFVRFHKSKKRVMAELDSKDGTLMVEADHVIASDGVNSRAAIGIGRASSVYTIGVKHPSVADAEACEFWFGAAHAPGFYSWVFPHADGVSIGTGCADGRGLDSLLEGFMARRGLEGCGLAGARVYRIPLWGPGDMPLVHGNILFAGDSGGHVLPLTFEGIYYAMRCGMLAAEHLARPSDYARAWRAEFRHTFMLMRMLREWFLRTDKGMEQFVRLFERRRVMEFALGVWTEKKPGDKRGLAWYANVLRKI